MVFNVETIISLGFGVASAIVAVIKFILDAKNAKQERKVADLKVSLKEVIIPLMEQAEAFLNNGTDKENWVLKKLGDAMHIDFYKYKDVLGYAKDIISDICTTTKIDVNKVIVKEEKQQPKTEEKEVGTNGIF